MSMNLSPFTYFHCKKLGHWAKKCPFLKEASKKVKKVWVRKELKDHNRSENGGETLGAEASKPSLGLEKVKEMGTGVKVMSIGDKV